MHQIAMQIDILATALETLRSFGSQGSLKDSALLTGLPTLYVASCLPDIAVSVTLLNAASCCFSRFAVVCFFAAFALCLTFRLLFCAVRFKLTGRGLEIFAFRQPVLGSLDPSFDDLAHSVF